MNPIIRIGLIVFILALLALALWQWWAERTYGESEHGHVVTLQADSTRKMAIIARQNRQADDALAFGNRYKAQRDSLYKVVDGQAEQLSYAQKLVRYLQGLVDNNTLPAQVAQQQPDLTDERVVTAGLKTIEREKVGRKLNDSLFATIGVRDAKLLALKTDKLALRSGIVNIKQKAVDNQKGGVWPLNVKRKKQNREISRMADQVLSADQESDLEMNLNKP